MVKLAAVERSGVPPVKYPLGRSENTPPGRSYSQISFAPGSKM
jgi:hypothetical protein